jgi:hypothetical protein
VQGHVRIDAQDHLALGPHAPAEVRFLAADQARIEAPDLLECLRPHQRIAAAGLRLSDRRVPLDVAQPVVDRRVAEALAPAAADDDRVGSRRQRLHPRLDPARLQLAVPVDELHEPELRPELAQVLPALVACARSREGDRHVELDHLHAHPARQRHAAVLGAGIDVDDELALLAHRLQAAPQALALVASDGHHSQFGRI